MFVRMPIAAMLGLFFTGAFFLIAIFAPLIAPYGYDEVVSQGFWDPPSDEFWLGTDGIGRDLLSRMIYGLRTTIWIATLAAHARGIGHLEAMRQEIILLTWVTY